MRSMTLLPFLGLVFGVGVVAAAPGPMKPADAGRGDRARGSTPGVMMTMTPECRVCLGSGTCSTAKRADCKEEANRLLESHWNETAAPTLPMMKVNGTELPRDLNPAGKYFKYKKAPTTFTTAVWPKGKLQAVPVDRLGKVSAADAAKAHRQPDWDANGQKIATCDEYAYEEMYDVMRFLDAANACRGDRDCVMDVAYLPSTPGIAERTLNRKDGTPLSTFGPFPNQLVPFTGTMPKNEMFQLGAKYLYANGKPSSRPKLAKIPALESALDTGERYYTIGSGSADNKRKFANEWKWHAKLREKTQAVSQAEREEYERRLAKFRELTAQHAAVAAAEEAAIAENTEPGENRYVLPYDMQTSDIFERYDRVSQLKQQVQRGVTRVNRAGAKGGGATKRPGAVPQQQRPQGGAQQQHGGAQQPHSARAPMPAIGMLGALGPAPQTSADKPIPKKAGPRPTKSTPHTPPTASQCILGSDDDWGLELHGHGRISCKIGEFLRQEWERKLAGHKSCLDLDNPDCDWKPETFTTRVLDKVPSLDKYKYFVTRCKAWTSGTFSPPAKNLTKAKEIIDKAEEEIGEARKILEPYYQGNNDHGRMYKGEWGSTENYGDRDWFGAKLEYKVGWDVSAANSSNGNVCSLAGGLQGKLDAKAYMANHERKLVYGDVYAEVNKPGAPGQARFKAQLSILGDQVYPSSGGPAWVVSQVTDGGDFATFDTPHVSITVPVGPVPVTGSLWGTFGMGYELSAKGTSPSGCNTNSTAFGVTGGFGPVLFARGNGRVGVGIAGIVSAGISATLTLLQISLPLEVGMSMKSGEQPTIVFDSSLELMLATLAGRVSLYIEFLFYDEEWELFRWSGIGPTTVHLMPKLTAELPISGMKP